MNGLISMIYFLATTLFNVVIFALWIRLALRATHISSLHPMSQMIQSITNPFIAPISTLLSYFRIKSRHIDWACLLVLLVVECLKFIFLGFLLFQLLLPITVLLIYVLADLIIQPCDLLFYALLIRVVINWFDWRVQNPFMDVVRAITNPLLRLGYKIIPTFNGFDFVPFALILFVKSLEIWVTHTITMI